MAALAKTITIQPGVYDISNEEYHKSAGISNSKINVFRESPLKYWDAYINENPAPPKITEDLIVGNALHTFVLEPDQFDKRYIVIPEKINKQRKAGKEIYAQVVEDSQGRIILDYESMEDIKGMAHSIERCAWAKKLTKCERIEKSIYWIDEQSQMLVKCRPDIWHDEWIVDIKTTNSVKDKYFNWSIYDYGYHRQAAMLLVGSATVTANPTQKFIHLAVEKKRPYEVVLFVICEDKIMQGRAEYQESLMQIKEFTENNLWHEYSNKLVAI